jgi:hypothetical protein
MSHAPLLYLFASKHLGLLTCLGWSEKAQADSFHLYQALSQS